MIPAVLQVTLALVLLAAAGGKLVRTQDLAGALRLSGFASGPAKVLARLVPALEILVAVALLMARGGYLRPAFLAALAVLAAFTGWLVYVRVRRLEIRCNCFGVSTRKVTLVSIVRNLALLVAAGAGAGLGGPSELPEISVLWAMTAISISAAVLLLAVFNQVRSHLVLSIESMRRKRELSSGVGT